MPLAEKVPEAWPRWVRERMVMVTAVLMRKARRRLGGRQRGMAVVGVGVWMARVEDVDGGGWWVGALRSTRGESRDDEPTTANHSPATGPSRTPRAHSGTQSGDPRSTQISPRGPGPIAPPPCPRPQRPVRPAPSHPSPIHAPPSTSIPFILVCHSSVDVIGMPPRLFAELILPNMITPAALLPVSAPPCAGSNINISSTPFDCRSSSGNT